MAESWGRDLKPPVNGWLYEIFGFGTFFRYLDFKNKIDAWETTVPWGIIVGWISQYFHQKF